MTEPKIILDQDGIRRALTRIAFEIVEKNKGAEHLLLAGVKTRGIYLAQRIAAKLGEVEGKAPPVLELDVTPWRDDVPRTDAPLPDLDPRIAGATVIIVAQRISSITHADQILVLEDGQIVARGRHEELLASSETYREIVDSQLSVEDVA